MEWAEVLAPAKINLFLELQEKRNDGFHELETVMTTVGLFDRLLFRQRTDTQTTLRLLPHSLPTANGMPLDQSNLIWRAIDLLKASSSKEFGVDVAVQKNIPPQAGLGGGSSDAAFTLSSINRLFQLGLSREQLVELANQLGSDIAFFLHGHAAVCTGRGDVVRPFATTRSLWTCIAMPPSGLNTAQVFGQCQIAAQPKSASSLLGALQSGRLTNIAEHMTNRLQLAAGQLNPWIERLVSEFRRLGCRGHQMTGSGSAYFGLFGTRGEALRASSILRSRLPQLTTYFAPTCVPMAALIRHRA